MLQVEGVRHAYRGGAPAIVFPAIAVPQGGRLIVTGASGSGKSTLLALMAALLPLQQGRLRVGTADLGALCAREADAWRGRELGFVPQRLHLSAGLGVAHNLALPYVAAGEAVDGARIAEVAAQLGLQALLGRRPASLSGGQAQRVALARAVLRRPRVLLADEPTASLDDRHAAEALALLAGTAAAGGATLVIATHDPRVRQALPDAVQAVLGAAAGDGQGRCA